jgi:hypothetical protein
MNPLARRSPRILLVAAVSTTAWVGSTTGASALMRCDPTISDCPDEASGFTTVKSPQVTTVKTVSEKTIIRDIFVDKSLIVRERTRTLEVDPRWYDVVVTDKLTEQTAGAPAEKWSVQPLGVETLGGVKTAAVRETPTAPAATAAPAAKSAPAPKAVPAPKPAETSTADVTTTSAATGTVGAAPEQHEVSAPPAVVTEALPRTGGNGAALTVLGLALIAGGAAMRTVARD